MGDRLLDQVAQLGREFVRRGMRREAGGLRVYYLAIRAGLVRGAEAQIEVRWSRAELEEWSHLLRLPPFENAYPLGLRVPCRRCKPGKGGPPAAREEKRWAGGALLRCSGCGWRWVVDDAEANPGGLLIHAPRWGGG